MRGVLAGHGCLTAVRQYRVFLPFRCAAAVGLPGNGTLTAATVILGGAGHHRTQGDTLRAAATTGTFALITWQPREPTRFDYFPTRREAMAAAQPYDQRGVVWSVVDVGIAARRHPPPIFDRRLEHQPERNQP